jgi:hypothetical protein
MATAANERNAPATDLGAGLGFGTRTQTRHAQLHRTLRSRRESNRCGASAQEFGLGEELTPALRIEVLRPQQHDRGLSLDRTLSGSAFLDCIAQAHELVNTFMRLYVVPSFEIVHRGSTDRAKNPPILITHCELDCHSIEVIADYLSATEAHC